MRWFYHIARIAVRITIFLFTSCTLQGMKTIPRKGPLLIVVNHLSLADPPLVSVSITRETVFMAKQELFNTKFSNYFIRSFGAFPVRRGTLDRQAIRDAEKALKNGKVLVMFPEATRSKNTQLQEAYPGAAMIALRTGTTVLAAAVTGTEKINGFGWLFKRPRIKLVIGQPFHPPQIEGKITREDLANFTEIMMEHIAELLPTSYRGRYLPEGEINAAKS